MAELINLQVAKSLLSAVNWNAKASKEELHKALALGTLKTAIDLGTTRLKRVLLKNSTTHVRNTNKS